MLFISNQMINYKTYDKLDIDIGSLDLEKEIEQEIPIIDLKLPPPPPPPPPVAPQVIDIVDDEEEVEETVIESTETDQEDEILDVEDVEVEDVYEDVEVPISVIENVPEYPGCEKGSNADKRKCMSDKIAKFVQRKFNTDLAGDLGLSGKQRINVIFKIDKNGNVTGVRSRAPHPRLEKEAARVINLLPKMKPGRQRGKAVVVPYSLPITFKVQD
jgi:protein TonB